MFDRGLLKTVFEYNLWTSKTVFDRGPLEEEEDEEKEETANLYYGICWMADLIIFNDDCFNLIPKMAIWRSSYAE